jgi:hypothetical protein
MEDLRCLQARNSDTGHFEQIQQQLKPNRQSWSRFRKRIVPPLSAQLRDLPIDIGTFFNQCGLGLTAPVRQVVVS